jgi:hypothetical protein
MSVTTIAKIAGIVAKMRADLQAVGGFDNGMLGVPAAGVRTNIEALEAALAASEVQAEPALSDSTIDAAAEAAYWQFDARRKGYAEWRGAPQSERDAFKAEARALARGHFPVRADEVRPAAPQQPAPRVPQAEPVLTVGGRPGDPKFGKVFVGPPAFTETVRLKAGTKLYTHPAAPQQPAPADRDIVTAFCAKWSGHEKVEAGEVLNWLMQQSPGA